MTSFIIIAKEKQNRVDFVSKFCSENAIAKVDISLFEKETVSKQTAQSIGIEEIKKMQKTLYLKPIQSETKLVIIEDAQLLTPEAQNALLKVLEEPPDHTIIILGTTNKDALLPTIHSRCTFVHLDKITIFQNDEQKEAALELLQRATSMTMQEKLKIAERYSKDKDVAQVWLEQLLLAQRELVLQNASKLGMQILRNIQTAHLIVKTTNVSPRFTLEFLLLSL